MTLRNREHDSQHRHPSLEPFKRRLMRAGRLVSGLRQETFQNPYLAGFTLAKRRELCLFQLPLRLNTAQTQGQGSCRRKNPRGDVMLFVKLKFPLESKLLVAIRVQLDTARLTLVEAST